MGEIKFLLLGIGEGSTLYYIDDTYKKFEFVYGRKCEIKQIIDNSCTHNNVYIIRKDDETFMTIINNITAIG